MTEIKDNIIRLVYQRGPKSLHILRRDITFWVDGIQGKFRSPLGSLLFEIIISAHPNTATTEQIFGWFRGTAPIGSYGTLDVTIHKLVHSVRQDLDKFGLAFPVLENVRSVGYRLADGWIPEPAIDTRSIIHAEISEIRSLMMRCISLVNAAKIVANPAGLMYAEIDRRIAMENFILLDRIGWQIIHCITDPAQVPHLTAIKQNIFELMSYVVFWRVGHRITESEWKDDYHNEIKRLVDDLEMRVERLEQTYSRT